MLHAAGVLQDAALPNQTAAKLRTVAAAKAAAVASSAAAWQPVGAAVLFSSIAAFMGSQGQANYSAANAALDGLAGSMQAHGHTASSVQWGAWAGGGMASDATRARVQRMGMDLLDPEQGLSVLAGVLRGSSATAPLPAVVLANPFSWPRFLQAAGAGQDAALRRMYGAFADGALHAGGAAGAGGAPSGGGAVAVPSLAELQAIAAGVMGSSIDVDEPLMAAGCVLRSGG